MKIKSIELKNHTILGDLFLDFTDHNGEVCDTILLAGENGIGKSKILHLIFEFSQFTINNDSAVEGEREIIVQVSDNDVELLEKFSGAPGHFNSGILNGELIFTYNYSLKNTWEQIKVRYQDGKGELREIHSGHIASNEYCKNIFKSIFSDVEINFASKPIQSVTSQNVDQKYSHSVKSSPNLATEITQLLVDVQSLDDAEFTEWGRNNIGKPVMQDKIDSRMGRFMKAFSFMFPTKKYKKIKNENGKQVVFEDHGKEINIQHLSSGEKQIVFRGGFLLKDRESNKGVLVLIDEPEISLHPKWQLKIVDFYKKLFSDEAGTQTSQIFFATHSPFIIHNDNRFNDKIIVIKKDASGKICASENSEYYGWTSERTIFEAFDVNLGSHKLPIVLTEGKTDASLLQTAWTKLYSGKTIPWEIIPSGIEIKKEDRSGGAECVRRSLEFIANLDPTQCVIGVFDNDREGNQQFNGLNSKIFDACSDTMTRKHKTKNIYGLLLPPPASRVGFVTPSDKDQCYLQMEHYFSDIILNDNNLKGKPILKTEIFSIKGDKTKFSEKVSVLPKNAFGEFEIIFRKFTVLSGGAMDY